MEALMFIKARRVDMIIEKNKAAMQNPEEVLI